MARGSSQQESLIGLVQTFADAAKTADESLISGDRRTRIRAERAILRTWNALCKASEGREVLTQLFEHPDPSARVMAAAFLLRYAHDDARAVLEEAAKHKGIVAFQAQECLKRWEEGEWHLDD